MQYVGDDCISLIRAIDADEEHREETCFIDLERMLLNLQRCLFSIYILVSRCNM